MLRSFGVFLIAVAGLGQAEVGATAHDAVLIEFSSKQCNFCRSMEPVISEVEAEGVAVRRVDVDREPAMAVRYGVRQLPTYVVVADGKETGRLVGMQPIDVVRRTLAESVRTRLTPTGAQLTRSGPPQQAVSQMANAQMANAQTANAQMASAQASAPATRLAPAAANRAGGGAAGGEPTRSLEAAVARAEAATVRLRVFEDVGYGVGTGTIIDAHGGEMLVLTCGHLFRDSQGSGRIEVDVYHGGQVHTVPGQLVDYNAKDRDIALVSIQFNQPIEPVPVLLESEPLRSGQAVFSFGCDRGADPSRRDTRITGIDKYNQHLDLSNVEISGAPIDGRSGGGLFDDRGNLIGVCNAADYDDDIGIYAGPGEVYWQLARVRLEHLFRGGPAGSPAGALAAAPAPSTGANGAGGNSAGANGAGMIRPASASADQMIGGLAAAAGPQQGLAAQQMGPGGDDREVIVILRDRKNPAQNAQVVTFDTPPAALMQILQESR